MALRIKSGPPLTLKIDKLGRVLIPQAVRERLGLRSGMTLKLVEKNSKAIYLEPVLETAKIIYKNGVPVVAADPRTLKIKIDTVELIRRDREERDDYVAGISRNKK